MAAPVTIAAPAIMAVVVTMEADTTARAVITHTAVMDITTHTLAASGTAGGMRTVLAPAGAGQITTTSSSGSAAERPIRLANDTTLSRTAMLNRGLLLF
jgi:hypothetical protein